MLEVKHVDSKTYIRGVHPGMHYLFEDDGWTRVEESEIDHYVGNISCSLYLTRKDIFHLTGDIPIKEASRLGIEIEVRGKGAVHIAPATDELAEAVRRFARLHHRNTLDRHIYIICADKLLTIELA